MSPSSDSNTPQNFPQNSHPSSLVPPATHQNRKPRHRHTPAQLTALNDLFDKSEHPPLDKRSELAERLGMETKTVNAWFQNKRASSKKRTRSVPSHDTLPQDNSPAIHLSSTSSDFYHFPDTDDFNDEYPSIHSRSASLGPSDVSSSFYTGHSDHSHFYTESDSVPRRMRMRPSSEQTDELRKLYNINPHPTTEQRQTLASSIGMRYQSITNWFQNQRSLAKKKKEEEAEPASSTLKADYPHETRQYSAFPPPSHHPSLGFPPPPPCPSLRHGPVALRKSPCISPSMEERSPRRSSSHRSTTPYGSISATCSRPRRSRPEPYQLEALKELYKQTCTPTIEERLALALEIGMDVGKVTNWFRNLRQTARKRAKKSGSGDDDDDDDSFHSRDTYSAFASRSGTPSLGSSSSSMDMDADDDVHHHAHSDVGSEDEFQEAVTPSPEHSPSPPPPSVTNAHSGLSPSDYLLYHTEVDNAWVEQYSGIKVEDALLLLSFHRHIVH